MSPSRDESGVEIDFSHARHDSVIAFARHRVFVRELKKLLPSEEESKLAEFETAIAATTEDGDRERSRLCAKWALGVADRSAHSHVGGLVKELREARTLEKDAIFGAEFGTLKIGGVESREDARLEWVDDAVTVAEAEAKHSGWVAVPWQELLKELLVVTAT